VLGLTSVVLLARLRQNSSFQRLYLLDFVLYFLLFSLQIGVGVSGVLLLKVFESLDLFAFVTLERRSPDQDTLVGAPRNHEVALGTEIDCGGLSLVALQRLQDLAVDEVQNFDGAVVAGAREVVAARVQRNLVYDVPMRRVVLNQPLTADVVELDFAVARARRKQVVARVELDVGDSSHVVHETVQYGASFNVGQVDTAVVTARGKAAAVRGESHRSQPIRVARVGREHASGFGVLEAHKFVVAARQKHRAVSVETYAAHGRITAAHHHRVALGSVVPDAYGVIHG